ncbi:hypothetical protein ACFLVX_00725 [Chloroflexota bacterium]
MSFSINGFVALASATYRWNRPGHSRGAYSKYQATESKRSVRPLYNIAPCFGETSDGPQMVDCGVGWGGIISAGEAVVLVHPSASTDKSNTQANILRTGLLPIITTFEWF